MIKSITIFKNIENPIALLDFYVHQIFPVIHKIPGVLCTDVTRVNRVSPDISQDLDGIEIIMETHFESEEAMQRLIFSPEGMELMQKAGQITSCEVSFFNGHEKRFTGELTENSRERIARIGYEERS